MVQVVKNQIKKYSTFIKYVISAGISFGIDVGLFTIFTFLFKTVLGDLAIFVCNLGARVISSFFNYLMNRNAVFKKDNNSKADKNTLIKYYILVVIQFFVSTGLIYLFHNLTSFNETLVKIPVDVFIFMVNYFVQKLYIFKK